MPRAELDGLSLHYEQEGSGDPPFVFVPGWCCDHTVFQPQFDHFRAAHSVTTLDPRGCGASDRPADGYDIPTLANDVAALCGRLAISKPVVVGHSLGGMIGIELAARHPSLPAAIVAVDPGAIDPVPRAQSLYQGLVALLEATDGEAARRAYVEALFQASDDSELRRRTVETMCSVPQSVAAEMIRGVLAWNGVGALLLCHVPLLVLLSKPGGSNDPARLLPLKPDVHFGMTVGAGHFHQLVVPEQVNSMIERFVEVATGR